MHGRRAARVGPRHARARRWRRSADRDADLITMSLTSPVALVAAWGGEGFRAPARLASAVLAATCAGTTTAGRSGSGDRASTPRRRAAQLPRRAGRATSPSTAPASRSSARRTSYAGLLVSMHMSGLYRQRATVVPAGPMRLSDEDARSPTPSRPGGAAAVVAGGAAGGEARRSWHDYALLQVADLVSLFCASATSRAARWRAAEAVLDAQTARACGSRSTRSARGGCARGRSCSRSSAVR